ncbi:hypothetical protein [Pseudanabaena sp. PCC 6802]|uniref:hypothetical protein n=1 Tax=Pseudanabaena sp. PCC 6802 TaxID=118173 RepID=UPI00034C3B63|nr:hypothetical protein [Pseudanabaena sp. PCC 6802]
MEPIRADALILLQSERLVLHSDILPAASGRGILTSRLDINLPNATDLEPPHDVLPDRPT